MRRKYRFTINYEVIHHNNGSSITIKENLTGEDDLTEVMYGSIEYLENNNYCDLIGISITDNFTREIFGKWSDVCSILTRDITDIKYFVSKEEILIEYTDYINNELSKRININDIKEYSYV